MGLKELISKVGVTYRDGSSTLPGVAYHEVPLSGMKFHRGGTTARVEAISKAVPLQGKRVLDIGCSVGGISQGLAISGAEVIGIDADPDAIAVAREVCPSGEFIVGKIDEVTLPKVDVVVWLSQWMWSVKQSGREHGLRLLFDIPYKTGAKWMVFESAANDGKAKMPGVTQKNIMNWLTEYSPYTIVKDAGAVGQWLSHASRHMFVCARPVNEWDGCKAKIVRPWYDRVIKTYEPEGMSLKETESKCLRRLEKYPEFPKILKEEANYIVVEWAGGRARSYRGLLEIVEILKKENIVHRDINPLNLRMKDDRLMLIDFGWALIDGEGEMNPQEGLGRG